MFYLIMINTFGFVIGIFLWMSYFLKLNEATIDEINKEGDINEIKKIKSESFGMLVRISLLNGITVINLFVIGSKIGLFQ